MDSKIEDELSNLERIISNIESHKDDVIRKATQIEKSTLGSKLSSFLSKAAGILTAAGVSTSIVRKFNKLASEAAIKEAALKGLESSVSTTSGVTNVGGQTVMTSIGSSGITAGEGWISAGVQEGVSAAAGSSGITAGGGWISAGVQEGVSAAAGSSGITAGGGWISAGVQEGASAVAEGATAGGIGIGSAALAAAVTIPLGLFTGYQIGDKIITPLRLCAEEKKRLEEQANEIRKNTSSLQLVLHKSYFTVQAAITDLEKALKKLETEEYKKIESRRDEIRKRISELKAISQAIAGMNLVLFDVYKSTISIL